MSEPAKISLKKSIVTFVDGTTGTPLTLALIMDDGNLTWTEGYPREYIPNRGDIATGSVRDEDDVPMSVSFQGRFNKLKSGSGELVSLREFLKKEGAASAHVTTGDICEPYCVDIRVHITNDCGTVLNEIITFPQFRVEEIGGDFQAGQLDISGRCKAVAPTSIRTAS